MVHDVGGLTVSLSVSLGARLCSGPQPFPLTHAPFCALDEQEAHRLESATTQRLLSNKKLSLIVDLDQTIVHATVDPTVGEWLKDPSNPNFGALKGVGKFKLGDEVPVKRPKEKKKKIVPKPDENGEETQAGAAAEETLDEEGEDEEDEDGCWYYIKMRYVVLRQLL